MSNKSNKSKGKQQKVSAKQRQEREKQIEEKQARIEATKKRKEKFKKGFIVVVCVILALALTLPTMGLLVMGGNG